jgi:hypothetical protein
MFIVLRQARIVLDGVWNDWRRELASYDDTELAETPVSHQPSSMVAGARTNSMSRFRSELHALGIETPCTTLCLSTNELRTARLPGRGGVST